MIKNDLLLNLCSGTFLCHLMKSLSSSCTTFIFPPQYIIVIYINLHQQHGGLTGNQTNLTTQIKVKSPIASSQHVCCHAAVSHHSVNAVHEGASEVSGEVRAPEWSAGARESCPDRVGGSRPSNPAVKSRTGGFKPGLRSQ